MRLAPFVYIPKRPKRAPPLPPLTTIPVLTAFPAEDDKHQVVTSILGLPKPEQAQRTCKKAIPSVIKEVVTLNKKSFDQLALFYI